MGFTNDVENVVRDYLDGDYEVTDTTAIPDVENVAFGKKAKKMNMCTFCIDLRKSSDLLFYHKKQTSGKIHKAFRAVASRVVKNYGGQIRSFQGDSILAFWPAQYKSQIGQAVKTAMVTKWFLDVQLSPLFEQYEKLDFGIGIDWGEVFIIRAGISRDANNNDLVFIGKSVNFAVAIADQARGPDHIEVSPSVYQNLEDEVVYDGKGNNMWRKGTVKWNEENYDSKLTSYYMSIS